MPVSQPVKPDDHSDLVPLLPIPNRTVKRVSADDSADSRVKVGHRQAIIKANPHYRKMVGVLLLGHSNLRQTSAMSDQLDLLGFDDAKPHWVPSTPNGRKPASEYELFLALRPDSVGRHAALRVAVEQLQLRYRAPTSKLLKPPLWHVTLLELGKFTGSYSGDALSAIQAACDGVASRPIAVAHEGLVSFKPSGACVLTCPMDTAQSVALLRQDLAAALKSRGVKCKTPSAPHMTLFYDAAHHLPATALDQPLRWSADGFALLCSHKGLGHHEVVRRWPASP